MLRYLFALALAGAALLVPVEAQVYTIQPRPMQVNNRPRGGFSVSFRYAGAAKVTFEDVGSVGSSQDIGDTLSLQSRFYDDGSVDLDTRSGSTLSNFDDGRTNRWNYNFDTQITPSGDIAFHKYSTASNGTDISADTGSGAGIDMQYDMVLGVGGGKVTDRAWSYTWGIMAGAVFSPLNAKVRQQVKANLVTITDTYSLEGAEVPHANPADLDGDGIADYVPGYTAPSTTTLDGIGPTGQSVTYTIDNTTLLDNRPFSRSDPLVTPDAVDIDGYWQVKGAYYSFRAGPWLRWQFSRFLSLRASVGATYSFIGAKMERDELVSGIDVLSALREGDVSVPKNESTFGVFGALDAEWWVSDRTGFFASFTYENAGKDFVLTSGDPTAGGRRAVVQMPKGGGFRAGISVLF